VIIAGSVTNDQAAEQYPDGWETPKPYIRIVKQPGVERHASVTDALLANAAAYQASFDKGALPLPPARKIAIVACMDARLNPYGLLGLSEGDAHVIRNAGGVVTDNTIRSLAISQRLLATEEVVLIHHTGCGMLTFTDDDFKRSVQDDVGIKPAWAVEAFADLDEDVRQSIARVKESPFLVHKNVRGFVYEVETGRLREVAQPAAAADAANGHSAHADETNGHNGHDHNGHDHEHETNGHAHAEHDHAGTSGDSLQETIERTTRQVVAGVKRIADYIETARKK
jgi:carbonic anhydrase